MKLAYEMPIEVLGPHSYQVLEDMPYFSPRYQKTVLVKAGFRSDGATGATDIITRGWIFHDWFTDDTDQKPRWFPLLGKWTDGTRPTRWESSSVLYDCLLEDGYWIRAWPWRIGTWAWGQLWGKR